MAFIGVFMPTIEELQQQILDLQAKNEQLETENHGMKDKLTTTEEDLKKSRDINGKLWNSVSAGIKDDPTPTQTVDAEKSTEELTNELIDECMAPTLKRMKAVYGDMINTDAPKE